ncbi:hypothetical protein [Nonomuraea dietziae]|uniref:hypothetical protein n=1 Tax=Nonomuraea dietziae TaxID=65515 RepID=UPI0031DDE518
MITVPGNKKAYYTFGVTHGKVTEYGIALTSRTVSTSGASLLNQVLFSVGAMGRKMDSFPEVKAPRKHLSSSFAELFVDVDSRPGSRSPPATCGLPTRSRHRSERFTENYLAPGGTDPSGGPIRLASVIATNARDRPGPSPPTGDHAALTTGLRRSPSPTAVGDGSLVP